MEEYNGQGGLFMCEEKVVGLPGWGGRKASIIPGVAWKIIHGSRRWWCCWRWRKKKGRVRLAKEKQNLGKQCFVLPTLHIDLLIFRH